MRGPTSRAARSGEVALDRWLAGHRPVGHRPTGHNVVWSLNASELVGRWSLAFMPAMGALARCYLVGRRATVTPSRSRVARELAHALQGDTMPKEYCCVEANDMRVIYVESTSEQVQVAYTVPEGKVFVLTAWTLTNEIGQRVSVRLRRAKERVAFNRIWDPARGHSHVTFPSGIAFGPTMQIEIEAPPNASQHYFYGYEHDA